jgi:peptidoglycan hydrolase-like protein with peptidoglycan-binding domain
MARAGTPRGKLADCGGTSGISRIKLRFLLATGDLCFSSSERSYLRRKLTDEGKQSRHASGDLQCRDTSRLLDVGGRQASGPATTSRSYAAAPNYNSPAQSASGWQNGELSPNMIRQVQQNLTQAGLYKGRADGVWGPQTEAAVRDYQQQHNLNATGQLDQPTLSAMNLGTNTNQSYNQNSGANGQQPANQRYGSNYNPPPSSNTQPNYNPPPPNNPTDQTNNDTGTPR